MIAQARVVVTGVTGNVGSALVRRVADEDDLSVVGVSRRAPAAEFRHLLADWQCVDISKPDATDLLVGVFRGAESVVHLAWQIQPSHREPAMRATNVDGTVRVLEAAARANVGHVVVASSVGAYSPGPKDRAVGEDWDTGGVAGSAYSRHKSEVERLLDRFQTNHPNITLTRLRPGLIFQRSAAAEIRRYFLGPLVPARLLTRLKPRRLPLPAEFVFQVVHADDVAEAYLGALRARAGGAFNVATDPVVGPSDLAALLDARPASVPARALAVLADLSWRARLQRTSSGWIDLASQAPIMATGRARSVLGWTPRYDARATLDELVAGVREGAHGSTPPLRPLTRQPWSTR